MADLAELIGMLRYLGYACLGLVLALVATTTLMAESVLLSFFGGTAGVASALAVLTWSDMAVAAEAVAIAVRPSARLALSGMVMSASVGVLAGLLPAWQAARADIVTALRPV